jgi:hypothetical protein
MQHTVHYAAYSALYGIHRMHCSHILYTLHTLSHHSATGDDWTDVMYTAQYGCAVYYSAPMPGYCKHPHAFGFFAVIFFTLFFVMGRYGA